MSLHHPARALLLDDAFARMEQGAHEAAAGWNLRKPPSTAQALANNYKKGPVLLPHGLRIKIDNPRGTFRTGTSPDGTSWSNRMAAHYGDIVGTKGADGDAVDIFLGLFPESPRLWVINQRKTWGDGGFDEHKVMAGFVTEQQAIDAYLGSYDRGWTGLESIVPCTYAQLKWWLRFGDCTMPFTAENLPFEGKTMDNVRWDKDANPVGMPMHQLLYGLHQGDAGEGLLLDAATMAELMGDPDIEGLITLDALVVQVSRMSIKMDMLKKVMEAAGDTVKPTEVTISDPFRSRGVLQVMVLFQMSDGQTITVWMHNPDTTPNKLTPMDDLISWKWMLNKKDVTIVVAPERGQELNIREVARRVMRLVERNSDAFKRANAKAAERTAATEALKTEIGTLEVELGGLQKKIEVAKLELEDKPNAWRGGVPAFQTREGKMVITDWESGDPIDDFSGIAYDYTAKKFVLTEIENGERTINYLQAKMFKEAAPEAEALKEQLKAAAEEARQAKDKAAGKALVMGFIEDHGGELSDWDAAGADTPGGWERAKLQIHGVTVNLGVSNGGVVQVNGDPFTPGDRKMNVTPEAVEASILAVAPVPEAVVAERKAAQELAEQTAQRRSAEDAVLTEMGASPDDIAGMADDGGYAVIAADEKLSLKWQDVLDSLMAQRMVDVRNALREIGWVGGRAAILSKTIDGSVYGVEAKVIKYVGAGRNVIAIEWTDAMGGIKVLDSLTLKAADMAAKIDATYSAGIAAAAEAVKAEPAPVEQPAQPDPGTVVAHIAEDGGGTATAITGPTPTAYEQGKADFAAGLKRVPAQSPGLAELLKGSGDGATALLDDWLRGWDEANVAAPVLTVVEADRGRWRVAHVTNLNPISPSYPTQEEAQAAADAAMAAGNLEFPEPSDAETRDVKPLTDEALQAAAEAGAEVKKVYRNLADASLKDALPRANLSTEDGKVSVALWTEEDVARAVRAVNEAESQMQFRPFDPSRLKMPTAVQLGVNKLNRLVLRVKADESKKGMVILGNEVLPGWSNGHILDNAQRPKFIEKAITQYYGDVNAAGIKRVAESAWDKLVQTAKGRSTQVEPTAFYDYEERDLKAAKTIARNSIVMSGGDIGTWVEEKYLAYFWKLYKGCEFFADGEEGSIAVKHHGAVVGIIMPMNAKGGVADLVRRAKRSHAIAAAPAAEAQPAAAPAEEETQVNPIEAVDAAYQFADATPAFKEWVYESLGETDYSSFVSAKTIDQRAKELGLGVSWDVALTVLDGVMLTAPVFTLDGTRIMMFDGSEAPVLDAALDDAGGAYLGQSHDAIAATAKLVKFFRDFIRSDKEFAKDPTSGWHSTIMNKQDAQRILTELIDIAVNRKGGTTLTVAQEDAYADFLHDARVINDYLHKRIRHSGSRNMLRHPKMKALYPEIDNQPMYDAVSPIMIRVTSSGKQIGTMTPEEFRKAAKVPSSTFLPEAIKRFNAWKEEQGEPERAEQFLPKGKPVLDAVAQLAKPYLHRGATLDEITAAAFPESWLGYKVVDQAFVEQREAMVLPSAVHLSGAVWLGLGSEDKGELFISGRIVAVTFTGSKVLYSVALPISPQPKQGITLYAVVHQVPSEMVRPIADEAPSAAVLDAVANEHEARVALAGKPEPGELVLDFAGDVSAAICQLQIALDVVTTNEPINRERGDVEQADLEAKSAEQFRRAIDALKAGDTSGIVFDDAGESEEYEVIVGTIKRGGDVLGRAMVGGDGKSMIYVGAAGTTRVTYVSKIDGQRRNATWSEDDAADMVDYLVENTSAPAAGGGEPPAEPPAAPPVEAGEPGKATEAEGRAALKAIAGFMPRDQRRAIESAMAGEEAQYFFDKMVEMRDLIEGMPKTYEQDGLGGKAIAHLHYFKGSGDWYITERDMEPEQHQAFGLADLGQGGELGYISIVELVQNGVELDLHWDAKTLDEIRGVKDEPATDPEPAISNGMDNPATALAQELTARGYEEVDPHIYEKKVAASVVSVNFANEEGVVSLKQDGTIGGAMQARITVSESRFGLRQVVDILAAADALEAQAQKPAKVEPVLKPLTPQSPDRAEWEDKLTYLVEVAMEATRSDAQGLVEVKQAEVDAQFAAGATPEAALAAIWPETAKQPAADGTPLSEHDQWLGDIYAAVETGLEVTRSDAQGIVDAQEFVLAQSWGKGMSAQETAAKIIGEGKPAEPEPAAAPVDSAADRVYLQSLVNGTADMLDPGIIDRIEPMFAKYEGDAEMTALLNQAAEAYSNAAVAAAKSTLAG